MHKAHPRVIVCPRSGVPSPAISVAYRTTSPSPPPPLRAPHCVPPSDPTRQLLPLASQALPALLGAYAILRHFVPATAKAPPPTSTPAPSSTDPKLDAPVAAAGAPAPEYDPAPLAPSTPLVAMRPRLTSTTPSQTSERRTGGASSVPAWARTPSWGGSPAAPSGALVAGQPSRSASTRSTGGSVGSVSQGRGKNRSRSRSRSGSALQVPPHGHYDQGDQQEQQPYLYVCIARALLQHRDGALYRRRDGHCGARPFAGSGRDVGRKGFVCPLSASCPARSQISL